MEGSAHSGVVIFNIRDFGASGAGVSKDTAAIQRAIDACAAAGGGMVYCPPGTYLSGTLFLKSNVELHVEAGATILGSPDRADYVALYDGRQIAVGFNYDQYLICGRGAHNIAITGRGTIDGNGRAFFGPAPAGRRTYSVPGWRPGTLLTFIECQDIALRDIRLVDSPAWSVWPHGCERVRIHGITIINQRRGPNCDGIDPVCCHDVRISDCSIDTGDDCIAVYGWSRFLSRPRPCEDVVVTNCVLTSPCNAVRVGYNGDGLIRRCLFSNLTMYNTRTGISMVSTPHNAWLMPGEEPPKLGPQVEDISFEHILMEAQKPIDLWMDGATRRPAGIRNISIAHVTASARRGSYIGGGLETPIENVRLRDIRLRIGGEMPAQSPARAPDPYPVYDWDTPGLPYGLLCRHVDGLELSDVQIEWEGARGGWRNALRVEDARQVGLAGVVAGQAPAPAEGPAVQFSDVDGACVRGCRALPGTETFLGIDGPASARIALAANDCSQAGRAYDVAGETPAEAIQQAGNILPA
jgi:hypothetical protein